VIEKGREFGGKTRPSPSFDRVARQQSPTECEDTCLALVVKGVGGVGGVGVLSGGEGEAGTDSVW